MKHLRELLFSRLCCLITLLFFCSTALFSVDYINSFPPQPPCSCATHAAQHNTIKPSINTLKSTANHMPHVSRAETQTSSSSCKTEHEPVIIYRCWSIRERNKGALRKAYFSKSSHNITHKHICLPDGCLITQDVANNNCHIIYALVFISLGKYK